MNKSQINTVELTASGFIAHVLAVVLPVTLEGPGYALVPGGALPFVITTRRARGRGAAVRLVTPVTAVIVTITTPDIRGSLVMLQLKCQNGNHTRSLKHTSCWRTDIRLAHTNCFLLRKIKDA